MHSILSQQPISLTFACPAAVGFSNLVFFPFPWPPTRAPAKAATGSLTRPFLFFCTTQQKKKPKSQNQRHHFVLYPKQPSQTFQLKKVKSNNHKNNNYFKMRLTFDLHNKGLVLLVDEAEEESLHVSPDFWAKPDKSDSLLLIW